MNKIEKQVILKRYVVIFQYFCRIICNFWWNQNLINSKSNHLFWLDDCYCFIFFPWCFLKADKIEIAFNTNYVFEVSHIYSNLFRSHLMLSETEQIQILDRWIEVNWCCLSWSLNLSQGLFVVYPSCSLRNKWITENCLHGFQNDSILFITYLL